MALRTCSVRACARRARNKTHWVFIVCTHTTLLQSGPEIRRAIRRVNLCPLPTLETTYSPPMMKVSKGSWCAGVPLLLLDLLKINSNDILLTYSGHDTRLP